MVHEATCVNGGSDGLRDAEATITACFDRRLALRGDRIAVRSANGAMCYARGGLRFRTAPGDRHSAVRAHASETARVIFDCLDELVSAPQRG